MTSFLARHAFPLAVAAMDRLSRFLLPLSAVQRVQRKFFWMDRHGLHTVYTRCSQTVFLSSLTNSLTIAAAASPPIAVGVPLHSAGAHADRRKARAPRATALPGAAVICQRLRSGHDVPAGRHVTGWLRMVGHSVRSIWRQRHHLTYVTLYPCGSADRRGFQVDRRFGQKVKSRQRARDAAHGDRRS